MTESAALLTLVSYNIHRAVGGDGQTDHQRIAGVVMDLDADLIALQEVETPLRPSSGAIGLLDRLRREGYAPVLGTTMRSARSNYGNVLLSRLPLKVHRLHDLSRPKREPRGLIEAGLAVTERNLIASDPESLNELYCLATHLGLRAAERRWQIARLAERIDQILQPAQGNRALILIGDFNEWRRGSRRLESIGVRLEAAPARRTYPARWPLLALDRLWFGGRLRLEDVKAVRTQVTRIASDHLPLRATFRLGECATGSFPLGRPKYQVKLGPAESN
ncbi:MAG: endonuclease/exonuclease/phosphatase family protein [Thiohalocapsa sp.]